jgi:hypothetical protein
LKTAIDREAPEAEFRVTDALDTLVHERAVAKVAVDDLGGVVAEHGPEGVFGRRA